MTRTTVDPAETSWIEVYRRLTEIIIPRPIAVVSTVDGDGRRNLAPFSFYTVVSSNPPFIAFAPHLAGRTGTKKDTLVNIEATRQFVVAAATEEIAAKVNEAAATLPHGQSEFEHARLTPRAADRVRPALVTESPVNMECELEEIRSYGDEGGAGHLVVGRVLLLHIDPEVIDEEGHVEAARLRAVGRMGTDLWVRTRDTFPMPRPE